MNERDWRVVVNNVRASKTRIKQLNTAMREVQIIQVVVGVIAIAALVLALLGRYGA